MARVLVTSHHDPDRVLMSAHVTTGTLEDDQAGSHFSEELVWAIYNGSGDSPDRAAVEYAAATLTAGFDINKAGTRATK